MNEAFKVNFASKLQQLVAGEVSVYQTFADDFKAAFANVEQLEEHESALKDEIAKIYLDSDDLELYRTVRKDVAKELLARRNRAQCKVGHVWRSILNCAYTVVRFCLLLT